MAANSSLIAVQFSQIGMSNKCCTPLFVHVFTELEARNERSRPILDGHKLPMDLFSDQAAVRRRL